MSCNPTITKEQVIETPEVPTIGLGRDPKSKAEDAAEYRTGSSNIYATNGITEDPNDWPTEPLTQVEQRSDNRPLRCAQANLPFD